MCWKLSSLRKLRTLRRTMLRIVWGERWRGQEVVEVDSEGDEKDWVEAEEDGENEEDEEHKNEDNEDEDQEDKEENDGG